ncbi:G patch domain and ankyrin repeat-containing protein 1 homolog [Drosophila innubila]|uniref:G patch domain and ankyrin repeat-containing protein 1 homolog n=1 Tax=Drosophila innubila TaxID=198719 RepID=UPI00148BCF16|nr:G patch domain and ankyrin repeat-containing protein 1 homolog [Drosophila innubila]
MNSTGVELHPNWRALTTLNVPLKRFLRAGTIEQEKEEKKKHTIDGVSGDEVQKFYKEILQTPVSRKTINTSNNNNNNIARRAKETPELPFDRNRYFRLAINNNVKELCQLLITNEEELNARDAFGWTALMMASCEGSVDSVTFLLQLGANTEVADKSGNTALELAKRKNHEAVVQMLEVSSRNREQSKMVDIDSERDLNAVDSDIKMPFYCEVCQRDYNESTWRTHQTSTVHRFNRNYLPAHKLQKFNISAKNRGLQLMVKQGWDREHGLGPTQSGRLYPVKTVLRKQRTGLGIEQSPARVTHFHEFDSSATCRRNAKPPRRTRNEMKREKLQDSKRERRLRHELS